MVLGRGDGGVGGKTIRFKDGKSKKFQGTLWRPVFGEIVGKEAEVATSKKTLNTCDGEGIWSGTSLRASRGQSVYQFAFAV